jgi:hypothetical protein
MFVLFDQATPVPIRFVQSKKSTTELFLLWYQQVPHVNLDAASYGWLQRNSASHANPDCCGTIGYHTLVRGEGDRNGIDVKTPPAKR